MAAQGQVNFGLGGLWMIPAGANPTPVPVGILSDISIDFSQDIKELHGQYKFAVDIATGAIKLSGKAKSAQILGGTVLSAFAGGTAATGSTLGVVGETAVIGSTPYQVTVANSATWVTDLGVIDFTAGKLLTRVASAPATGQYSVAAGVYTFAAADTTHSVGISYDYTVVGAKTVSLSNSLMGAGSGFILKQHNTYRTKGFGWKFYNVFIPKLGFNLKAEAYVDVDVDFMMSADDTGKVFDEYVNE
jgi:hypothetical protein